jgi:hypothetical protein
VKEGFTNAEIVEARDSLHRRGNAFSAVPPVRPPLAWGTMSGYADKAHFFSALSRTWPLFPKSGDALGLLKHFAWRGAPIILMPSLTVARAYEELH